MWIGKEKTYVRPAYLTILLIAEHLLNSTVICLEASAPRFSQKTGKAVTQRFMHYSTAITDPPALMTGMGKPGPEIIKLFSCSTQLRMKFVLLIKK